MKQKCNENAANRYSYVGDVYRTGELARKKETLASMPEEWSDLHTKGYIHIHDLDAHGLTYNCLTFNILKDFPYEEFRQKSDVRKIIGLFDYLKGLFAAMGNEQSGGMALANFDNDLATVLTASGFVMKDEYQEIFRASIADIIRWCNDTHTRMGTTSYYVTFNIGLAEGELAKFLAFTLLDEFERAGDTVFKPNIVFKVVGGVNRFPEDRNYDLYRKALFCTAKKMIPTYLLCDSKPNQGIDPTKIAVMGCRTRVVADLFGENSSVGRGNIDNISINLPRLALEVERDCPDADTDTKLRMFSEKWDSVARTVKDILLDRFEKTCRRTSEDFPTNAAHHLWVEDFDDIPQVFRHGTLSIGFIGLSEAMEVLTGKRFYSDPDTYMSALGFVKHMREYCDFLRGQYRLNFSLLATSGELISGRFIELDQKEFSDPHGIFKKGFYTNSFHINVDSNLPAFRKIQMEGLFHEICNGGCISYVELGEAPLGNDEGLREYVECGIASGTHYLGFNFPKDVCRDCGTGGVFDKCPVCGGNRITRIRRVSGYLEILDGFTKGKKNEEKARRAN